MQTKINTKIVQPMPMTLPVPTVDSSGETVTASDDSGAGVSSGTASSSAEGGECGSKESGSCRGLAGAVPEPGAVFEFELVADEVFLSVDGLADESGSVGGVDDVDFAGAFPDVGGGGHQGGQSGDGVG